MPLLLPLIAGADIIGMALMALVLLAGAFLVVLAITEVVSHLPVIGPWFQSPVSQLADAVFGAIRGWLEAAVSPIVGLFSHPATQTDAHVKANVHAHVHHQQVANYESNRTTVVADTVGTVQTQLATAVGVEAQLTDQVGAVAGSLSATDRILGDVQSQLAQLYRDVAGLTTEVNGPGIQGAISGLQSTVGTVQSQLAQAYRDIAGANGQITTVAQEAAAAAPYTDTQVRAGVDAAEQQAAQGIASVRNDVLQGLLDGAPSIPADLTAALSAVSAAAVTSATFVRDCGEPMCDWWNGNKNPLADVLGLVSLAELATLVERAVADPSGAAREATAVADEMRSLGNDVLSLFGVGGQ